MKPYWERIQTEHEEDASKISNPETKDQVINELFDKYKYTNHTLIWWMTAYCHRTTEYILREALEIDIDKNTIDSIISPNVRRLQEMGIYWEWEEKLRVVKEWQESDAYYEFHLIDNFFYAIRDMKEREKDRELREYIKEHGHRPLKSRIISLQKSADIYNKKGLQ